MAEGKTSRSSGLVRAAGMLWLPEAQIKECLPQRTSGCDCVGRFGVWLTNGGALAAYYGAYYLVISCVALRLMVWVVQVLAQRAFYGILAGYGALLIVWISILPSLGIAIVAYIVIWLIGWLCFNKWTLITTIALAVVCYVSFGSEMHLDDNWLKFQSFLRSAWQFYKEVL